MILTSYDIGFVILYLFFLGVVAFVIREKEKTPLSFLLANRQLNLPLFVGSLVSTWYGGLLGVTEIAFTNGLAAWLTQGGFWYLSYLIFAFLLAEKLAESNHVTLPDLIAELFGEHARRLAIILNFINVIPIAYSLSLGVLLHIGFGWPIWLGALIGTWLAALYSLTGGFKAVVLTDMLQFLLMCFAVALVLLFARFKLGGADFLSSNLPSSHLSPVAAMSTQEIFVWSMIALSTLVDPNFYHRCYAAKTPIIAKQGVLLAIIFWILFDICSSFGGLYAKAAVEAGIISFPNGVDAKLAYPYMAFAVLPAGLKGLFFVGLLATAMSTIDSYTFIGAMTISHDILNKDDSRSLMRSTRWGIFFTATLAIILSVVFSGSFKSIWKTLGSLSTSALLIPTSLRLLMGYHVEHAGFISMIFGASGTLIWAMLRGFRFSFALKIEALIPGAGLALIAYLLTILLSKRDR